MNPHLPERLALAQVRAAIDHVDDGLLLLLAARRRLVRMVASLKPRAGVPPRDPARERSVRSRAERLAVRMNLPATTVHALLDLVIADGCRQQGLSFDRDQCEADATLASSPTMATSPSDSCFSRRLLQLLPPPRRVAPLHQALPMRWQRMLIQKGMSRVLAAPLREGALEFMQDRRLAVEVEDLGLRWVFEVHEGQLSISAGDADVSVCGSATDLLLLAGRLEDSDTLFFQRRLCLTGDTELGLTARNMLDRLPWESIPLALRIVINRGARFARTARAAHHHEAA